MRCSISHCRGGRAMWMRDHLPEVRVIVNGRFPQERNIAAFRGLPKREVEGEGFRGAQTISHPCSELQASQVLPTVLITYFALFRISDNASASCLFNFYPKLIIFFFLYLGGKSQMINGRGEACGFPGAEQRSWAGARQHSSCCMEMLTLILKIFA